MRYDPKDADAHLLEPGWYESWVQGAHEATSKKGNQMMVLPFKVAGPSGIHVTINDYFVAENVGLRRFKNFCASVNLDFDAGEVTADNCEGQKLQIKVDIERSERYGDKNKVVGFRAMEGEARSPVASESPVSADDDIPF